MAVTHLKSLQALELALRLGSLQAAAQALWVTPAAIGQRIKALEEYLGVDLLVRTRSGLRPTAELSGALEHLRTAFEKLETAGALLHLQRGDQIHIAATSDLVDLWLQPRLRDFLDQHPQISFCINGEGPVPLRMGPVDCEISFGLPRRDAGELLLFHEFVLPIATPENTRRVSRIKLRDRLEGFPLLHVDFYKDDSTAPNWPDWIEANRLRRTEPNRGIRFQRLRPALDAVVADAGIAICGIALLEPQVTKGTVNFPFSIETGTWTTHAFLARFRAEALLRPQVRRFRDWLDAQAGQTRDWLSQATMLTAPRAKPRRAKSL
jgi:LysR family transcriptional regulator, glycine cleavage system transcriptional activator